MHLMCYFAKQTTHTVCHTHTHKHHSHFALNILFIHKYSTSFWPSVKSFFFARIVFCFPVTGVHIFFECVSSAPQCLTAGGSLNELGRIVCVVLIFQRIYKYKWENTTWHNNGLVTYKYAKCAGTVLLGLTTEFSAQVCFICSVMR